MESLLISSTYYLPTYFLKVPPHNLDLDPGMLLIGEASRFGMTDILDGGSAVLVQLLMAV